MKMTHTDDRGAAWWAIIVFLWVVFAITARAPAATYTVNPGSVIQDSFPSANPGDTILVKNGTYTQEQWRAWNIPKPGTASAWIKIVAETPGGVIIDNGGNSNALDVQAVQVASRYLILDGIVFKNQASGVMWYGVNFVKMARRGVHVSGNGSGNTVALGFSHTTYCLAEECWTWGGARAGLMMGGGSKNIARRHVGRLDYVNTTEPIDGVVSFYNGTDCEAQNCIGIDCDQGYQAGEYGALFTVPTTGGLATRCAFRGCLGINANIPFGLLAKNGVGVTFDNAIAYRTSQGIYCRDPLAVTNSTFVDMIGPQRYSAASLGMTYLSGGYHSGGGKADTCVMVGIPSPEQYGFTLTNITRTRPANLLSAVGGATVLKKIGKSGTLWGEAGYKDVQPDDLWPFPNEQLIRDSFRTASANGKRGFCADGETSLTAYIARNFGGTVPVPEPPPALPPPPPTQVDPREQQIADLTAQVTALQAQLATAQSQLGTVTAALTAAQVDGAAKQTTIDGLTALAGSLQIQIDQLNVKIANAKAALQ